MTEAILTTLSCIDAADKWRHEAAKGSVSNSLPCEGWHQDSPSSEDLDKDSKSKHAELSSFSKSRKILIGHSFGGRALELAVAQAYLGDRAQSLQLYESNFGEDGTETMKLETLRKQKDTVEKIIEVGQNDIENLQSDKQRYGNRIKKLRKVEAIMLDRRSGSRENLSSAATTLENWMDSYGDRRITLQRCENYERTAVETCANEPERATGSRELRLIGCAVDHIQCMNDTYLCAIENSFARFEERNTAVELQDVLACDVEGGRPSSVASCPSDDMGDIESIVLKTLEDSYNKDDPTDVTGVREVAGEWADFYCSLRRQPMSGLSSLVAELRGGDRDGVEPIGGRISSFLDGLVGLISERIRVTLRRLPTEEVEKEFAEQVAEAEEHLIDLISDGRKELERLRDVVRLKTQEISEMNTQLAKIVDRIATHNEKIRGIMETVENQIKDLEEERNEMKKIGDEESDLVDKIWYYKDEYLRPPADLVLLINSASEAAISLQLVDSMSGIDVADDIGVSVPPAIVSITSRSDWATRGLFPVGSWLGRLTRLGPRAERGKWGLAYGTLGHQGDYITHDVCTSSGEPADREIGQLGRLDWVDFSVGSDKYVMERVRSWEGKAKNKTDECRAEERGKEGSVPVDYWVVNVPSYVIANHDQIFSDGQVYGYADRVHPRRPLLGIVEGLIKNWRLFEPRCARDGESGNKCGFLKKGDKIVERSESGG